MKTGRNVAESLPLILTGALEAPLDLPSSGSISRNLRLGRWWESKRLDDLCGSEGIVSSLLGRRSELVQDRCCGGREGKGSKGLGSGRPTARFGRLNSMVLAKFESRWSLRRRRRTTRSEGSAAGVENLKPGRARAPGEDVIRSID